MEDAITVVSGWRRGQRNPAPKSCRKCVYWPDGGNATSHSHYFCWAWIARAQGPRGDEGCARKRLKSFPPAADKGGQD